MYNWARELESNLSVDTCQRLVASFQDHFSPDSALLTCQQQRIVEFNMTLRKLLNETNQRLQKESLECSVADSNLANSDLMVSCLCPVTILIVAYEYMNSGGSTTLVDY